MNRKKWILYILFCLYGLMQLLYGMCGSKIYWFIGLIVLIIFMGRLEDYE